MAKIFQLKDLEVRKRALVAESEVYRQMLTLEIQNIRLYGARMHRKLAIWRLANPLLLAAGGFFGARLFGRGGGIRRKRRGKWSRILAATLMGWRLLRQYGPLAQTLWLRSRQRRASTADEPEEETPSAII